MRRAMATPTGSGTLPPSIPSTSQASSSDTHRENSAARERAFTGYQRNVARDTQLSKASSTPEYTRARNSLSFQYSAKSAACGSTSATNTAGVTQMSGINTPSYLHYLERKIKLLSSIIDSFCHELQRAVSLLGCRIDSRTDKLENRIAAIRLAVNTTGTEDEKAKKDLDWLNAKKVAYAADLNRRRVLLRANTTSQIADIRRQHELLNSKLAPFAEQLKPQLERLDSKIASHTHELTETITGLTDRYATFSRTYDVNFQALHT